MWTWIDRLDRLFRAALVVFVATALGAGIAWALWQQWRDSQTPALTELTVMDGTAHDIRRVARRAGPDMVEFVIRQDGLGPREVAHSDVLRAFATDADSLAQALSAIESPLAVWVESNPRGESEPRTVVQIAAAGKTLLSRDETARLRAARRADIWMSLALLAPAMLAIGVTLWLRWRARAAAQGGPRRRRSTS